MASSVQRTKRFIFACLLITFFIDRCLGNKNIAERLKNAGISIEIHDDHFPHSAQDIEWLPVVADKGWVILTKDNKIINRVIERMAIAQTNAKLFVLASQELRGEEMAEIFLAAIVPMQEFVRKHPAPFIAKLYRDGKITMWKDSQTLLKELEAL